MIKRWCCCCRWTSLPSRLLPSCWLTWTDLPRHRLGTNWPSRACMGEIRQANRQNCKSCCCNCTKTIVLALLKEKSKRKAKEKAALEALIAKLMAPALRGRMVCTKIPGQASNDTRASYQIAVGWWKEGLLTLRARLCWDDWAGQTFQNFLFWG